LIAIPALDLRGGVCVEVEAASYDRDVIALPDPAAVAVAWSRYGFRQLHVIDLDCVSGRGNNGVQVEEILSTRLAETQVGGGIRSQETIRQLLTTGAHRVVIGSRAIEDPEWLADMVSLFPGLIVVAADVRDRKILSHGWTRLHPTLVLDLVEDLNGLPLAGIMVTAFHREDAIVGMDLPLMEDLTELADFPVYASGGVGSLNDLRSLADRGVAAAIIGMPLYNGSLDPRAVVEEFSESSEFLA
jgi:phosphoribosylformimino-5-aminoimidazole carboxamide ribotide isomerase